MTTHDPDSGAEQPRYLDPATLEALGGMHLRARALVEGLIAGLHRSPHRGGSVEFAEYIEYAPGHEIRHIDWKVYAKSDKYVVKQFEDETNLRAYMLLDASGSMAFHSDDVRWSKLKYVAHLAATLAYLMIQQGDAVGALAFDASVTQFLPASSRTSHLDDLFFLLDNLPGKGDTDLGAALRTVAERARPRSLILLFSDMLSVEEDALNFMRVLRSRRYEVAIFHAIDPAELTLPYEGITLFEGMEDEGELLVEPDDLRDRYLERMQSHLEHIQHQCEEGDIEYIRFTTDEPIEAVALRFLLLRMGPRR
jgi:uncharacterized protein (DUF58 family)